MCEEIVHKNWIYLQPSVDLANGYVTICDFPEEDVSPAQRRPSYRQYVMICDFKAGKIRVISGSIHKFQLELRTLAELEDHPEVTRAPCSVELAELLENPHKFRKFCKFRSP